jgi:hypothetical protein
MKEDRKKRKVIETVNNIEHSRAPHYSGRSYFSFDVALQPSVDKTSANNLRYRLPSLYVALHYGKLWPPLLLRAGEGQKRIKSSIICGGGGVGVRYKVIGFREFLLPSHPEILYKPSAPPHFVFNHHDVIVTAVKADSTQISCSELTCV